MWTFLFTLLIVASVLLIFFVLMQEKGVGLSLTFGGQGNNFSTNRGAKKLLSYATTVVAVLFLVLSFVFVVASPRSVPSPESTETGEAVPVEEGEAPAVDVEAESASGQPSELDMDDFEVVEVEEGKFELTPKKEE